MDKPLKLKTNVNPFFHKHTFAVKKDGGICVIINQRGILIVKGEGAVLRRTR